MPRTVRAHQHETLDALCYRIYGRTAGIVEQTYPLNPGLAEHGVFLAQNTPVRLPADPADNSQRKQVQLWD